MSKYTIPEINVNFSQKDSYQSDDNMYFGQYKWTDAKKNIFPHYFKPVLSHLMLYDLWHYDKTFTYKDFIKYYDKYHEEYENIKHPEWKFIEDMKNDDTKNWKTKRNKIANIVIKKIHQILDH